jgi:hypothetical protein
MIRTLFHTLMCLLVTANSVDKTITKATVIFDLLRNEDGLVEMNDENYKTILATQLQENIGDDGKHKKLLISFMMRNSEGNLDLGKELGLLAPIVSR